MSSYAVLEITDGTTTVNLIDPNTGFFVTDWKPSVAGPKSDGVWQDSPMADNRRMVLKRFANVTETFELQVRNWNPDALIESTQDLRRLLEKATNYWLDDWRNEPVWIKAQGRLEDNLRYAVIQDYRTPTDGFPYGEPFWNMLANAAMDDFPLVLERGHWQSTVPGTGDCVQVSNVTTGYLWGVNLVLNPGFETAGGGGADVFLNWSEFVVDGTIVQAGAPHSETWCCQLTAGATCTTHVTQAVVAAPGNIVSFGFWAKGDGTNAGRYGIYDVTNAAYIIPLTTTGVTVGTWTFVSAFFTVPAGCVSVQVEFHCPTVMGGQASFDDVSFRIRGAVLSFGRAATCADEVYIANKQNTAQLTDVYHYTAVGAVYSANLISAATPFVAVAILPAVPAAGDMVYFGIDTSTPDSGPFCSLVFDIGTAQVDLTVMVWEYYSSAGGGTWVSLLNRDNTSYTGSVALSTVGVSSVHWAQSTLTTWIPGTINGITGYWVRCRISAIGAAPAPPTQQNRNIYTITTPYAEIASTQIGGDIPAATQLKVSDISYFDSPPFTHIISSIYRLIVSTRSTSRGTNFTPYINLSDEQNPTGITVSVGWNTAITNSVVGETGRILTYTSGAAEASGVRATIAFNQSIGREYAGKYRILLVVSASAAAQYAVYARTLADLGGTSIPVFSTETVLIPTLATHYVVDLGTMYLPPNALPDTYQYSVQIIASATAAGTLKIHRIIFVPVDEYEIDVIETAGRVSEYVELLDIDNQLKDLKQLARGVVRVGSGASLGASILSWQAIGNSLALKENAGQRIWLLTMYADSLTPDEWHAQYEHVFLVYSLDKSQRYLSMRGAR